MDGVQGRLNTSLQFRLSLWLSLVIVAVAVVAGVVSFFLAFNEANELQDDMLRQTAALFDRQHQPAPNVANAPEGTDDDPEARLIVARLPSSGGNTADMGMPVFPPGLANGIQTRRLDAETYRVFVKTLGQDERIAVAQQTAVRNETARNSALLALLPFLVLVPILLLVVASLVRTMFAPVAALALQVDQRREGDLQPIAAAALPREIRPFVAAINGLLARVTQSLAMQQRFVAAAAHELRSPMTALSLQAEHLAGVDMTKRARQRLAVLRQGIERNRALLDQLLTFARAQAAAPNQATVVSIQSVFRRLLEEFMPLAEANCLDIGVVSEADAQVVLSEFDLSIALKNLIANAIRYTPPGGRIDLSITETIDAVVVAVEDNGPGISKPDRERAFEPFYRGLGTEVFGSGLGLSIVKTVVDRLGGHVVLADAARSATGLCAVITIPQKRNASPESSK